MIHPTKEHSGSSRPHTKLDVVATGTIWIAALFAVAVLAYSVLHHERWNRPEDWLRAYGLPLIALGLLIASLKRPAAWRVNITMVLIPAFLALLVADVMFALKERRDVHVIGGRRVPRFASEAPVAEMRTAGIYTYSFIGPQQLAYFRHYLGDDSSSLYPLGGISQTMTYLCREADRHVAYRSDEHGFNNPPGIWSAGAIDAALVGDSFVHGVCVPHEDQIATSIRRALPHIVNVGILGAGPLAELGVVREYLSSSKPRNVLWFFYEGNDVDTVGQQPVMARRYLDSVFSQRLILRQVEIDTLLRQYADGVSSAKIEREKLDASLSSVLLLRHLRIALDIGLPAPPPKSEDDYVGLDLSLAAARRTISAWSGRMYLVYLPDSHRFDPRRMTRGAQHDDRVVHDRTMEIARRLDIPAIDILPAFAADANPRRFWFRPMSHYTPAGFRLVARVVLERLASDGVVASR